MAASAFWYGSSLAGQYSATAARRVDWVTNSIKVALATSAYTPNQDTHTFFSDVTNEVTGTGYSAGGVALGTKSVSYDSASNETRLLAAASSWSGATITARYAIVYDATTGVAGTEPLLGYVDFGGDQSTSAATFQITWDATHGVLTITAS